MAEVQDRHREHADRVYPSNARWATARKVCAQALADQEAELADWLDSEATSFPMVGRATEAACQSLLSASEAVRTGKWRGKPGG